MKHTLALAAAMIVAAAPAVALAQTTEPVTLVSSQAQPQIMDTARNEAGFASVTFVNHNGVAATEVDFALSSNGSYLATLADKGTFSPNVTIDHTFALDQTARDLQLSVEKVTFSDGTTWVNDASLPAGRATEDRWLTEPQGI